MSALWIAGGTAVLGTGLKAIEGFHQEHEANQLQKQLKDPVYNIPAEFYENREIARQMAQQGLPQSVINQQKDAIARNQAAAISGLSKSANPGANLSAITAQSNDANAKLNAEDAQAKQTNQRFFIGQNTAVADQLLAKQQSDVFDKFTRNFNMMQAYRGAGTQNLMGAANGLTNLGMLGLSAYAQNNGGGSVTMGQKYGLPDIPQTTSSIPSFTYPLTNANL